jgi:SpoVK/Ycf46/Vps4 family AAA+-type ATPase
MARYDLIYLVTYEEHKAQEMLKDLCIDMQIGDYWTWSLTDGARRYGAEIPQDILNNPEKWDSCKDFTMVDYFSVITWAESNFKSDALITLRGYNQGLNDPPTQRKLRDFCLHRDQRMNDPSLPYTPMVIIAPTLDIPKELEKEIAVVEMILPSYEEIMCHVNMMDDLIQTARSSDAIADEIKDKIVKACQGLSDIDIENALARSMAKTGELTPDVIKEFKRQIIHKNGQVDIIVHNGNLADVGGNDVLKTWITERACNFMDKGAIEFGCTPPKGLLLLGHPGTGKTLAAKSIASKLGLDLIRWDIGRSFKGLVGASENNAYEVLKLADAVSPCVLWIDEIDKALSGTGSSNFSDGGTTNRVYQLVLTWLQEHTSPVFVIATANDVLQLPDALMRAGRFDQVFWVDLPVEKEREEIFNIHLKKRGRNPENFNLQKAAEATEGFSGAEIEQVVKDSLTTRYHLSRGQMDIDTQDLVDAANGTKPLSVLRKDVFTKMRAWAKEHAQFASSLAASADVPPASLNVVKMGD